VERQEDHEANDAHMEVDDGNNGANPSEEKNNEDLGDDRAAQGKEKKNTAKGATQESSKKMEQPLEEMEIIHEEVLDKGENDTGLLIGNSNLNATQESHAFYENNQNTIVSKLLPSHHTGLGGVHEMVSGSHPSNIEFQTGNSSVNFNQETNDYIIDACITKTLCNVPHIYADYDSTVVRT
jgi:hypothetical protein